MAKKTYYEQLKDPKWQKKRLEIMMRANFVCESCGSESETLSIHHGAYLRGKAPWEYPDEMLHCFCEQCHAEAQYALDLFNESIGRLHGDYLHMLGMIADAADRPTSKRDIKAAIHAFCWITGLEDEPMVMAAELCVRRAVDRMDKRESDKEAEGK